VEGDGEFLSLVFVFGCFGGTSIFLDAVLVSYEELDFVVPQ